ncbi:MAG: hypothetical protein J6334_01785 [Kiritimatiellae bacterium]|nr:hypothetical protein [Kiritimatiellia bacterium]
MNRALIVISPTVLSHLRQQVAACVAEVSGTWSCEVVEVPAGADIVDVARRARDGSFQRVLAMGGDGTVAAVGQALFGTGLPLGILPAGTGNLLARELEIPLDPAEAFRAALGADTPLHAIDAMRINGRIFLLNAGVGVNAMTIDKTSRLGKTLFGQAAYVGTAVWRVLCAKSSPLELIIDGERRVFQATDVLISNCGGLARVLHPNGPTILLDDGLLNLCVVSIKTPLQYPWYYLRRWIFPKRENRIVFERTVARHVTVMAPKPLVVQADGDIIGETPIEIEVLPQAVNLFVPGR